MSDLNRIDFNWPTLLKSFGRKISCIYPLGNSFVWFAMRQYCWLWCTFL